MDYRKESLRLHGEWKGKVEVVARAKVDNKDALSLAYTPGVAEPMSGDSGRLQQKLGTDPPLEYGGGNHRRLCGTGSGRHWPGGRYARYGGQMRAV